MATFEIDEGRMVVPDGWEDRTVNSLEYDGAAGLLKVVMSRHRRADRPLEKMTDDVLTDMRRRLAGFELVEKKAIELDGEPAFEVHAKFRDGGKEVDQRSFWWVAGGKCVTLGVVHARPPAASSDSESGDGEPSADAAKIFEQIRSTIRLRSSDEQEVAAPTPLGPALGGEG